MTNLLYYKLILKIYIFYVISLNISIYEALNKLVNSFIFPNMFLRIHKSLISVHQTLSKLSFCQFGIQK